METGPNFELLKDAYAIIDGIPEAAIALDDLVSTRGEALDKGTVCSPAGWLAQHPTFIQLGLSLSSDDKYLLLDGEAGAEATTSEVMARVFALPEPDADRLFGDKNTYNLEDDAGLGDKRLWLHEVREYLKEHDQLSAAFEEELETRRPLSDASNPHEVRAV